MKFKAGSGINASYIADMGVEAVSNIPMETYCQTYKNSVSTWLTRYGRSVCRVYSSNELLGTGFLVAPDVILISKHALFRQKLVGNFDNIQILFDTGSHTLVFKISGAIDDGCSQPSQEDYLLLRLDRAHPTTLPIPLSTDQPGGMVFTVRYAENNPLPLVSVGYQRESGYHQWEHEYLLETAACSSGSPMVNSNGAAIGFHTAFLKDSGYRRGTLFATIASNYVTRLAKLLPSPFMLQTEAPPFTHQLDNFSVISISPQLPPARENEILEGKRYFNNWEDYLAHARKVFSSGISIPVIYGGFIKSIPLPGSAGGHSSSRNAMHPEQIQGRGASVDRHTDNQALLWTRFKAEVLAQINENDARNNYQEFCSEKEKEAQGLLAEKRNPTASPSGVKHTPEQQADAARKKAEGKKEKKEEKHLKWLEKKCQDEKGKKSEGTGYFL